MLDPPKACRIPLRCNTLQYVVTHCNMLQHIAPLRCSTLHCVAALVVLTLVPKALLAFNVFIFNAASSTVLETTGATSDSAKILAKLGMNVRPVSVQMCGRGAPSPGADVAGVRPVPVQMWQRRAQSRCRCVAAVSPNLVSKYRARRCHTARSTRWADHAGSAHAPCRRVRGGR